MLVANASKEVVHAALDRWKPASASRNFREQIRQFLEAHDRAGLRHRAPVLGSSNKEWHSDHVIQAGQGRLLIVDPVVREASSINARVVAHLDVRKREDPALVPRIVYDEDEAWGSADLSFLAISAPTVPWSHARDDIDSVLSAA